MSSRICTPKAVLAAMLAVTALLGCLAGAQDGPRAADGPQKPSEARGKNESPPGAPGEQPAPPVVASPVVFNFDDAPEAAPPPNWQVRQSGDKPRHDAFWEVVRVPDAPSQPNALMTTRTFGHGKVFNLFTYEAGQYRDVEVSVRLKPLRGREDRGGGLVWRCQDEKNYYFCRINPLETNIRVYKMSGSNRVQLGSAELRVDTAKWYTLTARMTGDHITCSVDGKPLLDVRDSSLAGAGRVGLWSKADAVSIYDDFTIVSFDPPGTPASDPQTTPAPAPGEKKDAPTKP